MTDSPSKRPITVFRNFAEHVREWQEKRKPWVYAAAKVRSLRKKKFSPPKEKAEITMRDANGKRIGGIILDATPYKLRRGIMDDPYEMDDK